MPKNLITLFSVFLLSISLAPPAFAVGQMSMLAPEDYDFSVLGGQNQSDAYKDLPPEAVLKVRNNTGNLNQLAGTTNTVFTFDGNGSTDAETSQRLLEVRFDFENDGRLDTYFSVTKVANHKYEKPGIKNIRMDVLDRAGNVSSITKKITVVENTPPLAHFSVSPKVGTTGTTFAFDTISSSDSQYNKNLLEYRFDFDTDGNFDTKFTSKTSYRHKFKEHGLKKVTLQVRDSEGSTSKFTKLIYVRRNTSPVARFVLKDSFLVDASPSYDKESKLKYKWDFNFTGKNDIQWDTTFTNSPRNFAEYFTSGYKIIRLMVKDSAGKTDTAYLPFFALLN